MKLEKLFPAAVVAFFFLYFAGGFSARPSKSGMPVDTFAALPAVHGGRLKPLDTIARTSLLMIHGKQSVKTDAGRIGASEWLMEMFWDPEKANGLRVIQIDNPDVLGLFGLEISQNRDYAFNTLKPFLQDINTQARRASDVKAEQRTGFQTAIVNLGNKLFLYHRLQNTLEPSGTTAAADFYKTSFEALRAGFRDHVESGGKTAPSADLTTYLQTFEHLMNLGEFRPIPDHHKPSDLNLWMGPGEAAMASLPLDALWPGVLSYAAMGDAYRAKDPAAFSRAAKEWSLNWQGMWPRGFSRMKQELHFNRVEFFMKAMAMYVVVFLLAVVSWLVPASEKRNWPAILSRAAFWLLLLAFAVHTLGLGLRIYLQGRPPVTNLYSSAIFVGWGSVAFGILLERLFKKGLGSAVAAVIGFVTLIVAHHLTQQGDTMEMMRAVLDSNFWLATHVTTITIGYSSTFLSGALGILYLLRERFDSRWTAQTGDTIERMVYGVVCFSAFFSFIGTILGGIWADQSWGRFWGWDPKENGALMIVLWNALVLHARWGRLASQRSLMGLVVVGNIITALSWFGVNMLGIGLHSYGFMQKAFVWLMIFTASQLAVIALAFWPRGEKP